MSSFFSPQPDVNYDLVCGVQVLGVVICVVLFALQAFAAVKAVEGFWIIFAPFIAVCPWQFYLRGVQAKQAATAGKTGKTGKKDKKA